MVFSCVNGVHHMMIGNLCLAAYAAGLFRFFRAWSISSKKTPSKVHNWKTKQNKKQVSFLGEQDIMLLEFVIAISLREWEE